MSDVLPVLRVLGALLAMFAVSLCVPLAASLWAHEGLWPQYAPSSG
jgi:trk system potassium uptake protein TrkH